jgi:hypothetical protein
MTIRVTTQSFVLVNGLENRIKSKNQSSSAHLARYASAKAIGSTDDL